MGNSSASRRKDRTDVESGALTAGSGGDDSSSGSSSPEPLPEWVKVLHRVPPLLREKKKHLYNPSVVSLGPFHHGRPHLLPLEEFKEKLVAVMLRQEDRRLLLRLRILERIDDVRHFYGGLSRDEHDDEALASMMLRDACLLLYCIELSAAAAAAEEEAAAADEEVEEEKGMLLLRYLGLFQAISVATDCLKLENQIPWWVLTSLISDDRRDLLRRFLSLYTYGNVSQLEHLGLEEAAEDDQPLHLLHAVRNAVLLSSDNRNMVDSIISAVEEESDSSPDRSFFDSTGDRRPQTPCPAVCSWAWWRRWRRRDVLQPPFRTVTELKAKGVYIRRSSSSFLLDVGFTSYYFFAVLRLPVMVVPKEMEVIFSNMMALEVCPASMCLDMMVTSYLMLIKSMVEAAEDVKELQEKGVMLSYVKDNEELVRMFKDMDSFGTDILPVFDEIMMRIDAHCSTKAKTWVAELINTNFRSPWAATALAAAALLLCLTFLQTYFTINPRA